MLGTSVLQIFLVLIYKQQVRGVGLSAEVIWKHWRKDSTKSY